MASVADLLEKIFALTSRVESLMSDVDRLEALVRDHHERIVRLEGRDELLVEKAKNASMSAWTEASHRIVEKVAAVEARLNQDSHRLTDERSLPRHGDSDT